MSNSFKGEHIFNINWATCVKVGHLIFIKMLNINMFKSVLNVNKTRFFFFKLMQWSLTIRKKKFLLLLRLFFFLGLIVFFKPYVWYFVQKFQFCILSLYFQDIFFSLYSFLWTRSSGFNFTSFFFFFSFCYHFHFVSNNFPCTRHFFLKLSIQCKVLSISIQHVQMQHKDLLNIFNILFITNCNNRNGLISTLDFTYFKLDVQINYQ